ncbi:MAG TPA: C-terminal binding protein [Chloroflexota bacterium]|jgi:D-3-phosphoglycerate dehydrogenase|nr:C-terminal binding protein [Chloroflexota bacterium]
MAEGGRPRALASGLRGLGGFFDPTRVELEKVGVELVMSDFRTPEELVAAAKEVDGIFESAVHYTRDVLSQLPKLKAICALGIGVDRFDLEAATELGIVAINLPRVFHREVAHHALALWLALVRKIVPLNEWMKASASGRQPQRRPDASGARSGMAPQQHIYGQTFGIVSLGNIGRVVATLVRPFEMDVIAYDPFLKPADAAQYGVKLVGSLNELFERADFVSVHTPLSKATHHLIGYEQFSRMKPSALFVNTGRGPVVDEAGLIRALQEGKLAGAGLDVQEKEPPDSDNPLLKMENVILTPHVASSSEKARRERARWMGIEMGRVLNGKWPIHGLVNKGVKPRVPLSAD